MASRQIALDRDERHGYSDGGTKVEPEGTGDGLAPPVPFGSKMDELLSPAAER
jgi:hypothetical protein